MTAGRTRGAEHPFEVLVAPSAQKSLARLVAWVQRQLARRLRALGGNPRPSGGVKLTGQEELWRIRVGDYRVIYEIRDRALIVLVIAIGHRKEIYRGR